MIQRVFNISIRLNDGTVGTVSVNDIDSLIHASEQSSVCVIEADGNQFLVKKNNVTFEGIVL